MLDAPVAAPTRPVDRTTCARWNGAVGLVLAFSDADPTARLVLVAVAQHADGAGRGRPSVPRLAAMTGYSPSTVRAALRRLEAAGELLVERVAGRASRYVVAVVDPTGSRRGPHRETAPTPPAPGAEHTKNAPSNARRYASSEEVPAGVLYDQADAIRRRRAADLDAELAAERSAR